VLVGGAFKIVLGGKAKGGGFTMLAILRKSSAKTVRMGLSIVIASCVCFGQIPQISIPEGTRVRVRLDQDLSGETAEEGQSVQLSVTEDVKIGDVVVIAQGANTAGRVVLAQAKRRMGRTGKIDFSVERVTAVDKSDIPLRYTSNKKEGGSHAVSTGIITAGVAVLFWPAAPFFLLRKGKEAKIQKGMTFEVFTDQTHVLSATTSPISPSMTGAPVSASAQPISTDADMATLIMSSDPAGADIEIDGNFAGNTPSTVKIPKGSHKIVLKKQNLVWQRDIELNPGSSITINATLEKE
jgi:hypothetical protein